MRGLVGIAVIAAATVALCAAPASADHQQRVKRLQRALDHLVEIKGGPPGASAVLYRGGRERFLHAGVADVKTGKPFRRQKQMRIASVSKAFSGAVALALVDDGVIGLDDSITAWVPALPAHWSPVTVRQVLSHTGGLPSYTTDPKFLQYFGEHLHGDITDLGLIDFVRDEPLDYAPGTDYKYSNTDNIVVALVTEAATGVPYRDAAAPRGHRSARAAPHGAAAGLPRAEADDPRLRHAARDRGPDRVLLDGVRERLRRDLLDPARPQHVHARLRRRRPVRRPDPRRAVRLRPRRRLRAARARAASPGAWRSSATRPAAARSSATPGTSPGTPSSRPAHATDDAR